MKQQTRAMLMLAALLLSTTTALSAGKEKNDSTTTIGARLCTEQTGNNRCIDLGDLFENAAVTIEYSTKNSALTRRARISNCTFYEKEGWNKEDIKTAKQLLKRASLIIAEKEMPANSSGSCTVIWEQDSTIGTKIENGILTINIQKALEHRFEGCAFMQVETDTDGKAIECDYIGGIIVQMPFKKPTRIENINIEMPNSNTSIYSARIRNNEGEYDRKVRAIHKSIRRCAKPTIEAIENGDCSLPANEQLFIAINISSKDAEPYFPGGSDALREYVVSRLKENERLKRNGITGHITVEFAIGTDGYASDIHIKDNDISGLKSTKPLNKNKMERITAKAVTEAFRDMPRWQPGRPDCRIACTLCTMQIEIN